MHAFRPHDSRMSKPRTIQLSEPIRDDRGEITEITVRAPTDADFAFVGRAWVIRLANADASVLDRLCPQDAAALLEVTANILFEAYVPSLADDPPPPEQRLH